MSGNVKEECGTCKHYAQGSTHSYCANKKQTNKELSEYAYYPFWCSLHEPGRHNTRAAYMANTIKKHG